jgi:mannose-6-phosphate isomerase-like protein (cupin superfamily)
MSALAVLGCDALDPTVDFFVELGFRVDAVFPADHPSVTRLSGHGLAIELRVDDTPPGRIVVPVDAATAAERIAPNGTVVELLPLRAPLVLPPPQHDLEVVAGGAWGVGRAGMRYRDLIPGRVGGRFIASHIHIPTAGPVPDYVHYHHVRFQMIFVARGWVRLVYEDQGEPFVLHGGDCVLQPPLIRHRVLESSADLEVIEIGCPAEHETLVEHGFDLPTPLLRPDRDFDGQVFVRHTAGTASVDPWRAPGTQRRDLGIATATRGLADAGVVTAQQPATAALTHGHELCFGFVLEGSAELQCGGTHHLQRDAAFTLPPGEDAQLDLARGTELLLVTVG